MHKNSSLNWFFSAFAPALWAVANVASAQSGSVAIKPSVNQFPERVCNVREHGASGTRIWFDTQAFQAAIDTCAKAGGGTVLVPRGEWLIEPISLRSNIRLQIERGAEVLGATDPKLFPDGERSALINIRDANNVAIVGEGLIDGQGAVWWERIRGIWRSDPSFARDGQARQQQKDDRPRLILAMNSSNLRFEGVRIENSPSFHLVLDNCEHVTIDRVKITAPAHGPNTDAIDPINSRHVLITNNVISVGDDVVAIKSERPDKKYPDAVSADIVIAGNTIVAGRGICIGSATTGGVQRVHVENNSFTGSMYGLRIKSRRGKGGVIRDVTFANNRLTDVETPLVFTGYYEYRPLDIEQARKQLSAGGFLLGNQIWPGPDDAPRPYVHDQTPEMANITVSGLTATGADLAGVIVGLPERAIRNFQLRDIRIDAKRGLLVRHADVAVQSVKINSASGPAIRTEQGGKLSGES